MKTIKQNMIKTKKDWICFLDEDNNQKQMFVTILKIDESFVEFLTKSGNMIMIPNIRILKIKKEEGKKDGGSNIII
jgi:hypothetical protein